MIVKFDTEYVRIKIYSEFLVINNCQVAIPRCIIYRIRINEEWNLLTKIVFKWSIHYLYYYHCFHLPKPQLVAANILVRNIRSHGTSIKPISINRDTVTVVAVEAWMLNQYSLLGREGFVYVTCVRMTDRHFVTTYRSWWRLAYQI